MKKDKIVKFFKKGEFNLLDVLREYPVDKYRVYSIPNSVKKISNREEGCYVLDKYDDFDEDGSVITVPNKSELEKKDLENQKSAVLQATKNKICSQISKNVSEHQQLNMVIDLIADCYNYIKQAFKSKEIQKLLKKNADISTLITSLIDFLKKNAPQHLKNIENFIEMRDNVLNEFNNKKREISEIKTIEELKKLK